MKIDDWRRKIDAIDTAMLHLLNLRTELALEVGRFKNEEGVALRVPAREQEILNRLKGLNPGPLDGEAIEKIYQLILDQSVRSQELQGLGQAPKPNGKAESGGGAREFAQAGRGYEDRSQRARRVPGRARGFQRRSGHQAAGREDYARAAPHVRSGVSRDFRRAGGLYSGADREQPGGFGAPVVRSAGRQQSEHSSARRLFPSCTI